MKSSGGRTQVWRSRVGNILNKKNSVFSTLPVPGRRYGSTVSTWPTGCVSTGQCLVRKAGTAIFWHLFFCCVRGSRWLHGRHTVVVVVVEEEKGKPIKVGTHARTRGRPGTQFVVLVCDGGAGLCLVQLMMSVDVCRAIQHRMTVG